MTEVINKKCLCSLLQSNINDGQFICVDDPKQVIFRAAIYGTLEIQDPSEFVDYLQQWIDEGEQSFVVGSIRLNVDQNCPAKIDSFVDLDCFEMVTSGLPSDDDTSTHMHPPPTASPVDDSMSALTYIVTGAVIGVLLFIVCIVVLIIFLVCLMNKQANKR